MREYFYLAVFGIIRAFLVKAEKNHDENLTIELAKIHQAINRIRMENDSTR